MATLPPSTDITASGATEGNAKTWFAAVRTFIAQQLGTLGTQAESLTVLGVPFNGSLTKTGAYTVVAADRGKIIKCSGTFTLSLTAAATLGDGFFFGVWNTGAGTITTDPNLSEQIAGATTRTTAAGKLDIVYCDGTAFNVVGSIATGSGSGLDADLLDGYHANNLPYAPVTGGNYVAKDHGHNNVGSFVFGFTASILGAGNTVSGSSLTTGCIEGYNGGAAIARSSGSALSGTWRCLGAATSEVGALSLYQRIS